MIADLNPIGGRSLPLNKTSLVTVDFVRAAYGFSRRRVRRDLAAGAFTWAWDINVKQSSIARELRFLADELIAPHIWRNRSLAEIITSICGEHRRTWSVVATADVLMCSLEHVYSLIDGRALTAKTSTGAKIIPRASLEKFLTQRRIA